MNGHMTNRQVALIAAAIYFAGQFDLPRDLLDVAEVYNSWLGGEDL